MNKRVSKPQDIRRRHAEEFKQSLVQRTLEPGASVAAIAQQAGVNANLLFNWRRLHLQAQPPNTCDNDPPVLLPVTVVAAEDPGAACVPTPSGAPPRSAPAGTIEIDINGARVRLRGPVDEASIRIVLHALASAP
ncbi:transposase [Paucibacter sp. O1-1]|nr:transposase [Paucibacter sp. O1-1]MCU7371291.1 transposase [Paucibacter sp. O1-1]MCU7372877.1 transposase [Paucibacter sp. O1-1]MCU7374888.1 transposase [Paucibacter sp. O1-1]MCU7374957.1 transposase [Paucibacter sp. O1-1]